MRPKSFTSGQNTLYFKWISVRRVCLFCLYRLVTNEKVEDEEEVDGNKTLSLYFILFFFTLHMLN